MTKDGFKSLSVNIDAMQEAYKESAESIIHSVREEIKTIMKKNYYEYNGGDTRILTATLYFKKHSSVGYVFELDADDIMQAFSDDLNKYNDVDTVDLIVSFKGIHDIKLSFNDDGLLNVTVSIDCHYRRQVNYNYDQVASIVDEWARANIPKSEIATTLIFGINRGGLIPAVMMSHTSGVAMKVIDYQTRDGKVITSHLDAQIKNIFAHLKGCGYNRIILVDDIEETGKTFNDIKASIEYVDKYIHTFNSEKFTIDTFAVDSTNKLDKWVVFPWELL